MRDLAPLGEVDFSSSENREGVILQLEASRDRLVYENLDALSAIPRFEWLNMNGIDAGSYLEYIRQAQIRGFSATDSFNDETLTSFIEDHPEIEELHIPWNEEVHDLTGLTGLSQLRYVKVSANMWSAIQSLEGQDYDFELEIEGQ